MCPLNTRRSVSGDGEAKDAKDWTEPDTLQPVRTYCLEETPICLAEATSEVRALFEIVF